MIDNIYCIYDRLSNRYGSVFSSPSHATASRQYKAMFAGSNFNENDYELCHVGNIEISTGKTHTQDCVRVDVADFTTSNVVLDTEKELEKKA